MPEKLRIKIRQSSKDDEDFIYSSWINSLGNSRPYSSLDRNWFTGAQHALIDKLLKRATVFVAHEPEDVDQIYGYAVVEPEKNVLHWVYVKNLFRRAEVARRLIDPILKDGFAVSIKVSGFPYLESKWGAVFKSYALSEGYVQD